jgi:DHA1 family tetracycline resistance protein-like MFS transporter
VIAAFSSFEATFALFSEARYGFNASTIGYVFAFVGVILAIVQGTLVGRMARLVGEHRVVPMAILVLAVGLVLIPVSGSITTLLVAVALLSVGMGFNSPSITSMISRLSHADEQGSVLGISQSIASLARIFGPVTGGFLYDNFGLITPYVTAASLMLVAFLISMVGLSRVPTAQSSQQT